MSDFITTETIRRTLAIAHRHGVDLPKSLVRDFRGHLARMEDLPDPEARQLQHDFMHTYRIHIRIVMDLFIAAGLGSELSIIFDS